MANRILWVVEIYENGTWLPTVGVSLTREAGRRELRIWRGENPHDSFRVRRYIGED